LGNGADEEGKTFTSMANVGGELATRTRKGKQAQGGRERERAQRGTQAHRRQRRPSAPHSLSERAEFCAKEAPEWSVSHKQSSTLDLQSWPALRLQRPSAMCPRGCAAAGVRLGHAYFKTRWAVS